MSVLLFYTLSRSLSLSATFVNSLRNVSASRYDVIFSTVSLFIFD